MKNALWQWAVGLLLTIVIALGGAFWAVSVYAGEREADLRVLQTRVDGLEKAIVNISTSLEKIADVVNKLRAEQAAFKGELTSEIRNLQERKKR